MKRTLFPIFFICLGLQLYAQQQPPEIEWTKTFGKSDYDRAYSITNTPDGGYAVAGYTYSKEDRNGNLLILKLDMRGDMEWNKTFGTSGSEKALSIINTPDGGYAVAGYTDSKGVGSKDMWILKLDDQGNLIWDKTYGGKYDDKAYSISNTSDSGYVVAGYTMVKSSSNIDMLVLKLDKNGNKVWEKTFSGSFRNYANSIIATQDGGCIVAGYIHPSSGDEKYKSDMWRIIKLDKTGNTVWDKIFGGDKEDKVKCIIATPDEEYIVAGYTSSKGAGNKDMWIMKLDKNGNSLWDNTFGGTAMDGAVSIVATQDGSYVVAGYNESKERYNRDIWILKLDKNGDMTWEKTFGGKMNDNAECFISTPDGGYVLAGYSCSKYNYDSKPVKCKIRIFKLYGIPSKSVENYVKLKINRWQKKGEFEKTKDYQKRVGEANRQIIIEKYTREATNYYGSRKIKLDEASLSEYNADNESFMINIPDVGEIFIKIPIDEAQSFKLNWQNVQFKNSQYDLINNRLILDHLDIVINGKIYTYQFSESTGEGNMEFTFKSEDKYQEQSLYRGGGDPLKGLNISKAKSKSKQFGKYYALMIGIDNYKGDWTPLNNAVNDVKTIEDLLNTKYKFDHFITLYNEEATRENIINKFVWLVENVKENDNVLIFYSGHGEFNQSLNKGYWVPVDAQTASISKYISNSDIQTFLGGIKSKHTLLIADACFSGDIFRGKTVSVPFEDSEKYYREVYGLISRQAITSGGIEPVMDGGRDGHSVFAYYFIKILNNNKSKYLEATRLYEKIKIPVINNSDQSPKFQSIKNTGDEGGQFIFIKK